MDVVRSCPVGKMRFREGDSPVNVTWFFAAPDAKIFEEPTIFRLTDYESTPFQNNGLGTQYPPRGPWRNGQRPARLTGKVRCSEFLDDWWRDGIPDGVTVNVPRLSSGAPICCSPASLGLSFSGKAKVRKGRLIGPPAGLLFGGALKLPALYQRTVLTNPTPGMTFSANFTCQPWTLRVNYTLQAAGGGGGGSKGGSFSASAGAGGSSGGSFTGTQSGSLGSLVCPYTLGGGGVGGGPGNSPGMDGTADTSITFLSLVSCSKGKGGAGCPAIPFTTGVAAILGGAHQAGGNPGGAGLVFPGSSGNQPLGGEGGPSVTTGSGGDSRITEGNGQDADAVSGSGGAGGVSFSNDKSGGSGGDSFIVIEEYNF